ncbi:MAG: phosphate acyltransferase PlsX [Bacteroidetes bacterium]|nr:phosphate acyltransferase PlsX [Bacteroidota bacterium]NCQ10919.1 phosphate acyltransferase PlsX [Bacteroidota bacterium]
MRIAVDAVGGDFIPKSPVEGALEALAERPDLSIVLVGPEDLIALELAKYDYDRERVIVQHAPEIIQMHDSPTKVAKTKPNSSMHIGLGLHKKGEVNGFVSAGNTGALLAISTVILGRLEGVLRPTIASVFPTVNGFRMLVDAGANLEVKPEFLYQFGIMGKIYAENILNVSDAKIGILNVGEEEGKGTEVLKEAYTLLKSVQGFVGNIEGRDILPNNADVFVCDGLVGNITLKFGESIATSLQNMIKASIVRNKLNEDQAYLVSKVLRDALSPFDYQLVGGVPFLGVNGVSLVGHGSSNATAIKNMIFAAIKCVEKDVNAQITAALKLTLGFDE